MKQNQQEMLKEVRAVALKHNLQLKRQFASINGHGSYKIVSKRTGLTKIENMSLSSAYEHCTSGYLERIADHEDVRRLTDDEIFNLDNDEKFNIYEVNYSLRRGNSTRRCGYHVVAKNQDCKSLVINAINEMHRSADFNTVFDCSFRLVWKDESKATSSAFYVHPVYL